MKTVTIKSLSLRNFKGVRDLKIEFDEVETNIMGDNGTGKTTVFDAFTWLLFGKNGRDEKDFAIKTIVDGAVVPQIEHSVTGLLTVDVKDVELKRVYEEKWTRRRGSDKEEMTGHETTYYIDGIPTSATEYSMYINGIVGEAMFKLLTSSTYFNTMKWQDRREVLIKMAGSINPNDIIATLDKPQADEILAIITKGEKMADYKKKLAADKARIKPLLEQAKPRIDEVKRSMPKPVDFKAIKAEVATVDAAITEIDNAITNQVAAFEIEIKAQQSVHAEIGKLKQQIQTIEFEATAAKHKAESDENLKMQKLYSSLNYTDSKINENNVFATRFSENISRITNRLEELRATWAEVSKTAIKFKEGEFVCPTCQRELDPDTIEQKREEMTDAFEKDKGEKLANIKAEGEKLREQLTVSENALQKSVDEVERLTAERNEFQQQLEAAKAEQQVTYVEFEDERIPAIRQQIAAMELAMMEAPKLNVEGMKAQKAELTEKKAQLEVELRKEEQIEKAKARIAEIKAEEKLLAQQLADIERQDFAMAAYTTASMAFVESRINSKFNLVKWQMFNRQINGGIEETCVATINGVEYSDLNSAAKIQAGIDCINAMSDHYGYYLPCFCDNRESVNELPETKSQLINLVVTKDKTLVIR